MWLLQIQYRVARNIGGLRAKLRVGPRKPSKGPSSPSTSTKRVRTTAHRALCARPFRRSRSYGSVASTLTEPASRPETGFYTPRSFWRAAAGRSTVLSTSSAVHGTHMCLGVRDRRRGAQTPTPAPSVARVILHQRCVSRPAHRVFNNRLTPSRRGRTRSSVPSSGATPYARARFHWGATHGRSLCAPRPPAWRPPYTGLATLLHGRQHKDREQTSVVHPVLGRPHFASLKRRGFRCPPRDMLTRAEGNRVRRALARDTDRVRGQ